MVEYHDGSSDMYQSKAAKVSVSPITKSDGGAIACERFNRLHPDQPVKLYPHVQAPAVQHGKEQP
jgi:hypothetical protein